MLAICSAAKPMVFKAPKPSSNAERVSQGTKPGAQPGHKKHSTSSKQPSVSSREATKGGSSKAPTGYKTGHLKRNKDSSLTVESNPSQTSASTPVVTKMHKEDQQATGGPNSLRVTSEERANPWLSSGYDALANSIAEADPGKSAPSDFIPQQQGMNEGTKNTSYDHLFIGTDPHVLTNQTQYVSEGLETVLTQSTTDKGASNIAKQIEEVEASRTIKLEDLAKLMQNVQPSFKDLDSSEDDPIIVVDDSDEDEEPDKDGLHATSNIETEDASVPKSSSPKSSQIQELTNQVLILQSQKHKLELEKNKAEVEAALLKAQPSFTNIGQLNELLKQVHELEIEVPGDLKEIPTKLEDFTKTITSLTSQVAEVKTLQWELLAEFLCVPTQVEIVQVKLKTLDALPSLLNKVTNALNQFAQAIASKKN
ncbi:hypothetical protein Tco_0988730 [Tanacetum coccineum]|uniref:Uncharacterized protein n=1 Tax=Tanacetum coccineum TaxID=301880 RepID=A0ABQ5ERQ0_9ASTR